MPDETHLPQPEEDIQSSNDSPQMSLLNAIYNRLGYLEEMISDPETYWRALERVPHQRQPKRRENDDADDITAVKRRVAAMGSDGLGYSMWLSCEPMPADCDDTGVTERRLAKAQAILHDLLLIRPTRTVYHDSGRLGFVACFYCGCAEGSGHHSRCVYRRTQRWFGLYGGMGSSSDEQ